MMSLLTISIFVNMAVAAPMGNQPITKNQALSEELTKLSGASYDLMNIKDHDVKQHLAPTINKVALLFFIPMMAPFVLLLIGGPRDYAKKDLLRADKFEADLDAPDAVAAPVALTARQPRP